MYDFKAESMIAKGFLLLFVKYLRGRFSRSFLSFFNYGVGNEFLPTSRE